MKAKRWIFHHCSRSQPEPASTLAVRRTSTGPLSLWKTRVFLRRTATGWMTTRRSSRSGCQGTAPILNRQKRWERIGALSPEGLQYPKSSSSRCRVPNGSCSLITSWATDFAWLCTLMGTKELHAHFAGIARWIRCCAPARE